MSEFHLNELPYSNEGGPWYEVSYSYEGAPWCAVVGEFEVLVPSSVVTVRSGELRVHSGCVVLRLG